VVQQVTGDPQQLTKTVTKGGLGQAVIVTYPNAGHSGITLLIKAKHNGTVLKVGNSKATRKVGPYTLEMLHAVATGKPSPSKQMEVEHAQKGKSGHILCDIDPQGREGADRRP